MLDRIGMDIGDFVVIVPGIPDRVFIEAFLPDGFVSVEGTMVALDEMVIIAWIEVLRKIPFDRTDDLGIVSGDREMDDHMEMIRQDDDGVDIEVKPAFCIGKAAA
jgi:hypothetical protein